jgi:hypothetical protein
VFVRFFHLVGRKHEETGRALLENGKITFSGLSSRMVHDIEARGVRGLGDVVYFPSDGEAFLHALKFEFCGSLFCAGEVEE